MSLCVSLYVSAHLCVCVCVCLYMSLRMSLCMSLYVSAHVCVCVCVCLYMSLHMSLCVSLYVSPHVCVCVCLYMSLHIFDLCMYLRYVVCVCVCVCVRQYTMLTGRPPFVDVGYRELTDSVMLTMMQRIIAGSYSQDMPQWDCISDDAKKLIQGVFRTSYYLR